MTDEEKDVVIRIAADEVWNAVLSLWQVTGDAAAVGTVLSLAMCRFLPDAYHSMAKHHPARTPDWDRYVELALETHSTAIRKCVAHTRKRDEERIRQ